MHIQYHMTLDRRPDIGGLNQVYGSNRPTPSFRVSVASINIFTRCRIGNQHDILKTAVADVGKEQIDMSYKGELHTL